jgi:hypothetical protein
MSYLCRLNKELRKIQYLQKVHIQNILFLMFFRYKLTSKITNHYD